MWSPCLTVYSNTMATNDKDPIADEPLATLNEDTLNHIEGIKAELDRAAADLDALDELGIDTTRLRDKIDWGYKARQVILERFRKPQ